jgi:WD repeat-containing protein 90
LASSQCATSSVKNDVQTKIIVWDVKTLKLKLTLHQSVFALQAMAFSRDDRFLLTLGDYRKVQLTLWSTVDYTSLLHWDDESTSNYFNCLAWNPMRANEFALGGCAGSVRFCTIIEPSGENDFRLQVVKGQLPSSISDHHKKTSDVTACAYLISASQYLLCSTDCGFVTCWNTRTNTCVLHWKADNHEIGYMSTIKYRLITGATNGSLRLWNTETLENSLANGCTHET